MGQEEAFHIWHDDTVAMIEESFHPSIRISQMLAKLPKMHADALKILRTTIKTKYELHIASGKLDTDPYDDGSHTCQTEYLQQIQIYHCVTTSLC